MRIIMLGTGPFAVPTLRRLYESEHSVELLVSRPVRPRVGKGESVVHPTAKLAAEHGTPIVQPESVNSPEARQELLRYAPDILVVCDYGQILSPEALGVARLGGVNLHASLLPKYRGAAPINWAIYRGETTTGVSVIHMTAQLDAGPVIAQASVEIRNDETAAELEPRLAELGSPLVIEAIAALAAGTARPIVQDASQASRARRLKKEDGQIDWRRPAMAILNQVRAMQPWPKTFTHWVRASGEPLRLGIERVTVAPDVASSTAATGTVVEASARLCVATGEGIVEILSLQPAGKRVLAAEEFLRGYPVRVGDVFGS